MMWVAWNNFMHWLETRNGLLLEVESLQLPEKHLLALLGAYEKYKVEELCHMDSLQLFGWHALKMPYVVEGYHELFKSVMLEDFH